MTSPSLDRETTRERTTSAAEPVIDEAAGEPTNPRLTLTWKVVVVVLTLTGVAVTMNQVFFWNLFGIALPTNSFLYLVSACFLPMVLIFTPASKKKPTTDSHTEVRRGVPWYDVGLIALFIACALWFCSHGTEIAEYGWALVAPTSASVLSFVYWGLVVEILRRAAGLIVAGLALAVSLYPLVADIIPVGFLQGITYDPVTLAQTHVMGSDSINGLPLDTAATILVGFMLFGIVLQHTGGAAFFNDLAMSIFGKYRGGSAKVSVGSSAAMGMMSGSAVSNVLTTGPMTIPAMIKSGFSPKTAGAVEATASSGGSITPPVMGTAAFLMVSFIGVPYTEVLIAAALPAFLYFLGIFLQVDGYAARRNLTGTPKDQLPRFRQALVEGWPYITAIVLLTLMLVLTPSEAQVPYWITALLIGIAIVRPSIPFGPRQIVDMILAAGKSLGQIIGIIAGVGLILGGLSATGVALSLSRDLIVLVGENLILILIAGALACFILGMGLTISAAYVFLAIVMAPAVTALGVEPIAAHLFIIYWASVSYITPPVGLAAFAAASISKASPMGTCFHAMKFGAVKYVVPFGFVLNPAIVAQGTVTEIVVAALASVVAVFALSAAFSGYLQFVETQLAVPVRILLAVGGFLVFLPQWTVTLTGLAIVVLAVIGAKILAGRGAGTRTGSTINNDEESIR
ncbi:MAG: TRAP transporter permease [Corynebacterium sp.]|uniref:TRAP transporter permease n=1 Tax=Corynebacterium sp. TaxID=1720 RepID=UPI003F0B4C9A